MPKITKAQEASILLWSKQVKEGVIHCETGIKSLHIATQELNLEQAKIITLWNRIFLKVKIKINPYILIKPHLLTKEANDAIRDIQSAVRHVRKTIIPRDLRDHAVKVLQKSNNNTDSVMYAESEDNLSVSSGSEDYIRRMNDQSIQAPQRLKLEKVMMQIASERHIPDPMETFQQNVQWALNEMRRRDQLILMHIRSYAKHQYDHIQMHHDTYKLWRGIVKEANEDAKHQTDDQFEQNHVEKNRRNEIRNGFLKGMGAVFLSPFMLNYLADPLFKLTHTPEPTVAGMSASGVNTGLAVIFMSMIGTQQTTADVCVKKVEKMIEEEPFGFAEKLERFLEHKLNGVAKDVSQLFNDNATLLEGFKPIEVISAIRMQIIKQMNVNVTVFDEKNQTVFWGGRTAVDIVNDAPRAATPMMTVDDARLAAIETRLAKTEQYMMFDEVAGKVTKTLEAVVDNIFKTINKEYPDDSYIQQIEQLYKKLGFDDTQSGLKSITTQKLKQLKTILAKHLHIRMLIMYLAIYNNFFGGNATRPQPLRFFNHQFEPNKSIHFGLTIDEEGVRILEHIMSLFPDEKKGRQKTWQPLFKATSKPSKMPTEPSNDQQVRRELLLDLMVPYIDDQAFYDTLAEEVINFAGHDGIELKKTSQHQTGHNAWQSEKELLQATQLLLFPLIEAAKDKRQDTTLSIKICKQLAEDHALLYPKLKSDTTAPLAFRNSIIQQLSAHANEVHDDGGALTLADLELPDTTKKTAAILTSN